MGTTLHAQDTGTLRLLIDPGDNFQFVVDRRFRMQQREVTLSGGPHHFAIWAPTRTIVDTTLQVVPGRTTDFVLRLPYSQEYLTFRGELDAHVQKRRWARTWPVAINVGAVAWTIVSYNGYRQAHRQLETDLATYENSVVPADITVLKEEIIPAHKRDFRQARDMAIASAGVTVLSAGFTWWRFKRTAQWPQPVFEDKERIRFEGLAYLPGRQGGHWATAITIPLAR
ncbi:MAG: hypothetical protein KIT10_01170 [Flavobacteriales bacterium]|nr:hypothetical protein [Flavobacteriales bacterium]